MDPRFEKTFPQKCKTIESVIVDDELNAVPVEIDYDYTDYYGWDKWEVSIWGYDYKLKGEAKCSPKELAYQVRDIIREEEKCTVTFY